MADLQSQHRNLMKTLLYGNIPELRMTKEFGRMTLEEIRAANIAVRQFRGLLMTYLNDVNSKNTVFHAYNRFTDVTYKRAMDLAIERDGITAKEAGIGRSRPLARMTRLFRKERK